VRAKHKDILDAIRNEREISKATEDKLKVFFEQFVKTFA
jgi:F-type H+-transporting ATPase subunit alpha